LTFSTGKLTGIDTTSAALAVEAAAPNAAIAATVTALILMLITRSSRCPVPTYSRCTSLMAHYQMVFGSRVAAMRRLSLVLATFLLVGATPAGAAKYRTGTYKGKTDQGSPVKFRVAKQSACRTGKEVNGTGQSFKRGTCVQFVDDQPRVTATCDKGQPKRSTTWAASGLLSSAGVAKFHQELVVQGRRTHLYELRVTLKRNGTARGTAHLFEMAAFDNAQGQREYASCDSGTVKFTARRRSG
jgi:hypothetical protein